MEDSTKLRTALNGDFLSQTHNKATILGAHLAEILPPVTFVPARGNHRRFKSSCTAPLSEFKKGLGKKPQAGPHQMFLAALTVVSSRSIHKNHCFLFFCKLSKVGAVA